MLNNNNETGQQHWDPWESPKGKTLLTKKEQKGSSDIFQKKHLDDPQDFDENVMWIDDMKVELF